MIVCRSGGTAGAKEVAGPAQGGPARSEEPADRFLAGVGQSKYSVEDLAAVEATEMRRSRATSSWPSAPVAPELHPTCWWQ